MRNSFYKNDIRLDFELKNSLLNYLQVILRGQYDGNRMLDIQKVERRIKLKSCAFDSNRRSFQPLQQSRRIGQSHDSENASSRADLRGYAIRPISPKQA